MTRRACVGTVLLVLALRALTVAGERYALIIGINDYEKMGDLKACVADAEALAKVLIDRAGFTTSKVVLLTDKAEAHNIPTMGHMMGRIRQITQFGEKGDTVLIFFSGHGTVREGQGYLVPRDGDQNEGISLDWVSSQLAASKASSKLLILDACHAGSGSRGVGGIRTSLVRNVTMLLSCGAHELSYPDPKRGHGVFSWFLIQGLGGAADANRDRQVSVSELYGYVKGEMKTWGLDTGKTQVPVMHGGSTETMVICSVVGDGPVVIPPPPVSPPVPPPVPRPVGDAEVLLNRGVELQKKGLYEQAIQAYSQAIELRADYALAYHNRAAALCGMGRYDMARRDAEMVRRLGARLEPWLARLIMIGEKVGQGIERERDKP